MSRLRVSAPVAPGRVSATIWPSGGANGMGR